MKELTFDDLLTLEYAKRELSYRNCKSWNRTRNFSISQMKLNSKGKGHSQQPKCKKCGYPLGKQNKTGYCRHCFPKRRYT